MYIDSATFWIIVIAIIVVICIVYTVLNSKIQNLKVEFQNTKDILAKSFHEIADLSAIVDDDDRRHKQNVYEHMSDIYAILHVLVKSAPKKQQQEIEKLIEENRKQSKKN